MGREKKNKPYKPFGRRMKNPTEWYATVMTPWGFQHFDARVNGASLVLTISPGFREEDGEPSECVWMLRLTRDSASTWCRIFRESTAEARAGAGGSAMFFNPELEGGTIGRLAHIADAETDHARMTRYVDSTLDTWKIVGQEVQRLVPQIAHGQDDPSWTTEDMHLCGACGRPVFDSMGTCIVMDGQLPLLIVCSVCASGETQKSFDQLPRPYKKIVPQATQDAIRRAATATKVNEKNPH